MTYYLRFTDTPHKDIKRGHSYHLSSEKASGFRFNKYFNCYAQKLSGLCAYEIEADDLQEAIEIAEAFRCTVFSGERDSFCIMSGIYLDDCPEGAIIKPLTILYERLSCTV